MYSQTTLIYKYETLHGFIKRVSGGCFVLINKLLRAICLYVQSGSIIIDYYWGYLVFVLLIQPPWPFWKCSILAFFFVETNLVEILRLGQIRSVEHYQVFRGSSSSKHFGFKTSNQDCQISAEIWASGRNR